jgi:hypothetical protein
MKILKCTCKNEFQDSRYGKNMRVHTKRANGSYSCTVCSNNKSGS